MSEFIYRTGTSAQLADELLLIRGAYSHATVVYLHKNADGAFSICLEVRS
ncbi:hypothetical protein [Streptosporangium sp. NPDC004631]